jgi:hypothetical protein
MAVCEECWFIDAHRLTCSQYEHGVRTGYTRHMEDPVNKPKHYVSGGVESIDVIEAFQLNFNRGNVVKYVLRAGRKDPARELEDLRKCRFYIEREIKRLGG